MARTMNSAYTGSGWYPLLSYPGIQSPQNRCIIEATWLVKKMLSAGSVRRWSRQNRSKQGSTWAMGREAR
jgi:hypothetical protein